MELETPTVALLEVNHVGESGERLDTEADCLNINSVSLVNLSVGVGGIKATLENVVCNDERSTVGSGNTVLAVAVHHGNVLVNDLAVQGSGLVGVSQHVHSDDEGESANDEESDDAEHDLEAERSATQKAGRGALVAEFRTKVSGAHGLFPCS